MTTDRDTKEITAFDDAIAFLFVHTKMRHCFWHLVEQKFDMITATFKEGSSKMKVFNHLKGWINQLATHPETVEEHNFCKKEMLNWFSSSKIRNLVGSALVNQTLLWMNTSLFVHEQRWARVSYVNVPTFKNKCSTLVEGNNNFVKHKKSGVNANMHIDDLAKNTTSRCIIWHDLKHQKKLCESNTRPTFSKSPTSEVSNNLAEILTVWVTCTSKVCVVLRV